MATLEPVTAYAIGVLGSIGVEVAAALKLTAEHGGACPPIYKRPFYVVMRCTFALIAAGPLPVLMDAASWLAAFYLGISAPVVFDRLARGLQPNSAEDKDQSP